MKKKVWKKAPAAVFAVLMSFIMMATCVSAADWGISGATEDNSLQTASWTGRIDEMLEGRSYIEGEVVAVYDRSAGLAQDISADSEELGIASGEAVMETFDDAGGSLSMDVFSVSVISDANKTTRQILEELANDPSVISAEPNYIYELPEEEISGNIIADGDVSEGTDAVSSGDETPSDIYSEVSEGTIVNTEPASGQISEDDIQTQDNGSEAEETAVLNAAPEDTLDAVVPAGERKDFFEAHGYDKLIDLSSHQWAYGDNTATGHYSLHSPDWNNTGAANVSPEKEAVVAVIDSGIDYTHPDLAPVMVDMTKYKMSKGGKYGYNASEDGDPADPMDFNGHGTHCAGIIAAAWDGKGTSGVASGVKLCAVRASVGGGFSSAAIAKAYLYLIEACDKGMNLKSVNCSYGGDGITNTERLLSNELGKRGAIVCYASGNSSKDNDNNPQTASSQVGSSSTIIVNATNPSYKVSDYTDFGKDTTAVFAPGDAIIAPVCEEASRYLPSTDPEGRKAYYTFADSEENGVKVMYLDTFEPDDSDQLSYTKEEFLDTIKNWEEAGQRVSGSESFDGDGYSYEINAPKLGSNKKRALYIVSVPISKEDAETVSDFGFSLKSTLSRSIAWVRPIYFSFDESVNLNHSGTDGWLRPSDVWCSYNVVVNDNESGYPYYDGRMYFFVMLSDFSETMQSSKLYIDCVGAGTDALRYAFFQGTSMACPSITGSVAVMYEKMEEDGSLAGLSKQEQAFAVADAVKASTIFSPDYDGKCSGNGAFDFSIKKENYTPVIHSITVQADKTVKIKGRYFGSDAGILSLSDHEIEPAEPFVDYTKRDVITGWSDTEITVALNESKPDGLYNMQVNAANGKITRKSFYLITNNGKPLFEGKITMPEEISNMSISSMAALSGKVYLAAERITPENESPFAVDQLWSYDLNNSAWKHCKDIPLPEITKKEDRSSIVEINTYGKFVVAHVAYLKYPLEKAKESSVREYTDNVYLYNPEKDTWTELDLSAVEKPSRYKVFGTDNGLFIISGEYIKPDPDMSDEDGTVYMIQDPNRDIFRIVFDEAQAAQGSKSVKVSALDNAGRWEKGINSFSTIQSFGNTTAALSKYTVLLTWSPKDKKFISGKEIDLGNRYDFIGKVHGAVAYLTLLTCGAYTPLGVVFAGAPGNSYTGRGFDTFYLNEDGTVTAFEKYAAFSDLYMPLACYTDGYLVVWGDSYYNQDSTLGYMAYTKLVKSVTPEVKLSKTSYKFNGKVKKPGVTVTADGLTLKKDVDYTVSYASGRKNVGTYPVTVTLKGSFAGKAVKNFKITKAANTLKLKGKTAAVKFSKVKKKAQNLKRTKVIRLVKKGKGKNTYKISAVKKGKKSFAKYFKINSKTGQLTVKKGTKKGTYKVTVKVKAAGTVNYKAVTKTVSFKVKVK